MAVLSGKNGTLFLGRTEITPVVNWKLVTTSHNPDYAANDTGGWKMRAAGVRDASGSFEIKAARRPHCPVEEGDASTLSLQLDDTGGNYYQVPAIIDKISVDVDINKGEIVAYVIEFSGNGPVVRLGIVAKVRDDCPAATGIPGYGRPEPTPRRGPHLPGRRADLPPRARSSLADYGEIENRILAEQPDPAAEVRRRLADLPEARREQECRRGRWTGSSRAAPCRWPSWIAGGRRPTASPIRFWLDAPQGASADDAGSGCRPAAGGCDGPRGQRSGRMADCHGWPDAWPPPCAARRDEADETPLPWHRWAVESQPCLRLVARRDRPPDGGADVARISAGQGPSASGRRRVPLAEAQAICHQRLQSPTAGSTRCWKTWQKAPWLRPLEDPSRFHPAETAPPPSATPRMPCAMGRSRGERPGRRRARRSTSPKPSMLRPQEGQGRRAEWRDVSQTMPCDHPARRPRAFARGRPAWPAGGMAVMRSPAGFCVSGPASARRPCRRPGRCLGRAGQLHHFARDPATGSHQVEQIRIARDQLAEQRKTNEHLDRAARRGSGRFPVLSGRIPVRRGIDGGSCAAAPPESENRLGGPATRAWASTMGPDCFGRSSPSRAFCSPRRSKP